MPSGYYQQFGTRCVYSCDFRGFRAPNRKYPLYEILFPREFFRLRSSRGLRTR